MVSRRELTWRGPWPSTLVLAGLLLAGLSFLGGCSEGSSPDLRDAGSTETSLVAPDLTTSVERVFQPQVDYPAEFVFSRKDATQAADLIAVGEIVEVEPGRWNTVDGSEGSPAPAGAEKLVYTTYWLRPERYLYGQTLFGEPIPFRRLGGVVETTSSLLRYYPDFDPAVEVGDTVLVYLVETSREALGPGEPPGYWLCNSWQIFEKAVDGGFVRNVPAGIEPMRVTLARVEKEIAGWKQIWVSASEMLVEVVRRLQERGILVRDSRVTGSVAEMTIQSSGMDGICTADDPVNVVWARHELVVARALGAAVDEMALTVVDDAGQSMYATRQTLPVPMPGWMDEPSVNTEVARNIVRDEIGRLGLAAGMDLDSVTVRDEGPGSHSLLIRLSTSDLSTADRLVPDFMRGVRGVVSAADAIGAGIRVYQVDVADYDGPLYFRFIDDWLVTDGASWWLAPGVSEDWLGL